jgi:hypothetical protein
VEFAVTVSLRPWATQGSPRYSHLTDNLKILSLGRNNIKSLAGLVRI